MAVEITIPGVLTAVVAAVGSAYLARRGQNVADKHDIQRLTRLVEEVRSDVRMSEEQTRSLFAKDTATHVKRFDLEVPIYRELWNKVIDLDEALTHVIVASTVGISTNARVAHETYDDFRAKLTDLQNTSKRLEPFYAPEVSLAIKTATLPLRVIAAQAPVLPPPTSPGEREAALKSQSQAITDALHSLKEVIRARLYADATAAQAAPPPRAEQPKVLVVTNSDA